MTINEFAKEYYGLEPVSFRTKDQNKLQKQREKFGRICPMCKQPMTYISGTNVLVCKNEKCRGRERTVKTDEGEKKTYSPIFHTLDENGFRIAQNLLRHASILVTLVMR